MSQGVQGAVGGRIVRCANLAPHCRGRREKRCGYRGHHTAPSCAHYLHGRPLGVVLAPAEKVRACGGAECTLGATTRAKDGGVRSSMRSNPGRPAACAAVCTAGRFSCSQRAKRWPCSGLDASRCVTNVALPAGRGRACHWGHGAWHCLQTRTRTCVRQIDQVCHAQQSRA